MGPEQNAGKLFIRSAGMLAEIFESVKIILEFRGLPAPDTRILFEVFAIVADLRAQGLAGLPHLAVMVNGLDGLLEADGDEEADDDGGDVDEEVAPGVGGVVGWVDVEHGEIL
jgi:hypothetical protein